MVRHLLGIEELSRDEIYSFLTDANHFSEVAQRDIKKVPALRGKTVINLFLEPSTRTRTSFEIAGKWLSADTINISGSESSTAKGESLLDTARSLEQMCPDIIVIRHKESGSPHFLARYLNRSSVVNAGDGMHEHPTQALLDLLSLSQRLSKTGRTLEGLTVAIVGDVLHSRVARSNIWAHLKLGNKVRLVGPPTLVPSEFGASSCFGKGVEIFHDLREGLKGVDVVICLRLQLERSAQLFIPSVEEYTREYGISERILKETSPQSIVLHPGPMNRGIEITSEVADGPRSLVRDQVRNGVAVRMAVLFSLGTGAKELKEVA